MNIRDPIPRNREVEQQFEFLDLDQLLDLITEPNAEACRQLYADFRPLMDTAPGSANNHHTWEGGYKDHVAQTMNLFRMRFAEMETYGWLQELPASEQFTLSDGLTVLFLHDLEKPFKYKIGATGALIDNPELADKEVRREFREALIAEYGIELDENQQNALLHVEGVRDKHYRQGERVDGPLAALTHSCDLFSARVLYDVRGNGRP